ncbi:MAG TPA: hypothetical protein VGL46_05550 [Pseudonocardiaceae bacterium]
MAGTGRVDSTFYRTASMLRTTELTVGLRPLTQFDAYATRAQTPEQSWQGGHYGPMSV